MLGATHRGDGCREGGGYIVTWAIGHLVALAQPHEIEPAWKRWSLEGLPMLPKDFPLVVVDDTKSQFAIVRKILKSRTVDHVICATDAGREGELIFRYIYEAAGCKKPFSRLWISSLTPDAIRNGFSRLKNGSEYDTLADAARGRSRADWLVGMNLSRAYSLVLDSHISVGRVQTPTLAILVDREIAIRAFVPEDYLEVVATFRPLSKAGDRGRLSYEGTWSRPKERGNESPEGPSLRRRLAFDGEEAKRIVARALIGRAEIASVDAETRKLPPPLLYDLTELQRSANRLYGMSAQKTLDVAQALYERHKLISYPRTDSRHLSTDVATTVSAVVRAIEHRYAGLLAPGTGITPLGRRFVDDARVTDHHAIIPTTTSSREASLGADEQKIYDLVCRRLLQAWHSDHVYSVTNVVTTITSGDTPSTIDRYESQGTAVEQVGWKILDVGGGKKAPKPGFPKPGDASTRTVTGESNDASPGDQALPSGLFPKQRAEVEKAVPVAKRTRPPPRYNDATLLTAMETAGRTLEEKELSDAMRDLGLGTPATRAQIIETLIRREYVVRQAKSLEATDKGVGLIEVVHAEVKSPAMTGAWEAKLKRMQRGDGTLSMFMEGIETYVGEVIERVTGGSIGLPVKASRGGSGRSAMNGADTEPIRAAPRARSKATAASTTTRDHDDEHDDHIDADRRRSKTTSTSTTRPTSATRPTSTSSAAVSPSTPTPRATPWVASTETSGPPIGHPSAPVSARMPTAPDDLRDLLRESFGFPDFRPYQEAVCRSATIGRDLLLVMPTGAGKSLCYQLPGIARGGTTLVVSPLIALMEDQAAKLTSQGFRAERIHSGRSRAESRQVCIDYLAGRLDFLFIAPERLRVPGFPEMLAKRTPSLIAIDEAHCISQWGHDFRPDYRMLGQRLPLLRPAPIVALTATATPEVQDDIVAQLGLLSAKRFIHGFRRDNLAIEVVEMGPGERPDAVASLLADSARRPAIVYAATRKSAEELASVLGRKLAAAYHAGMDTSERDRTQAAFLSGKLEIIVATTAFGMGIDKSDVRTIVHAALPASLEGYYQEIGRAGRDGKPSVAILLHSFVDRKTHAFFHERDYPDPEVLESIHSRLTKKPTDSDKLRKKVRIDAETFEKALEKLTIHGGAEVSIEGDVTRGASTWEKPYVAQRAHKLAALEVMAGFAASNDCRMVHMIRHFGDQEDTGALCGLCDVCAPDRCIARRFREPSHAEVSAIARILDALTRGDEQATGRLHRETFPNDAIDRRSFEHLLGGLVRAGLVTVTEATFQKGGESIRYQRASLTAEGRLRGDDVAGVAIPREPTRRAKGAAPKRGSAKTGAKKRFGSRPFGASGASSKSFAKKTSPWAYINKAKKKKKRAR